MAQVINTNVSSLNAQHNLSSSQNALATSLQRLSSGLRINSAKDDAAGMSIASRMTSQIRGLTQAARNANDGISMAQTAEGALNEIGNNLQRIRELAVQSANASNSSNDRISLNNEATQLIAEINRVASSTQFNGTKLIDGTFTAQQFQVGANNGDVISISSIASASASSLGVGSASSYSTAVNGTAVTGGLIAGSLSINGTLLGASTSDGVSFAGSSGSAISIANAVNAVSGTSGVTATVNATAVAGTAITSAGTAIAAGGILVNGVDIGAIAAATGGAAERGAQVAAAVNSKSSQTGVTATFSTTTGAVSLAAADGRNVTVTTTQAGGITGLNAAAATVSTRSTVSLSSASATGITIADISGTAAAFAGLTAGYTAATATAGAGVSSLNLTTVAGSNAAMTTIDAALKNVNDSRAALGAYQNRFSSAVTNLQNATENVTAARSRIQDADFAAETAALTRGQILQQAGTAMLAQANSLPNGVLALLR